LSTYYTFKICGPSRTSTLTGRYPWGAGSYDMDTDNDATTTNFTLYPELMRNAGYKTAALGKWDVGYMLRNATPTYRGFDTFYGYYLACNADYWYHTVANGGSECTGGHFNSSIQDWSDNAGTAIGPGDREGRNGTYNRNLLSGRAAGIIQAHDAAAAPLFMYLAFQDVHEGCARPDKLGVQAPLATVNLYNTTELDTYKIHGAMLTELDYGVEEVVAALKARGMCALVLPSPPPRSCRTRMARLCIAPRAPLHPHPHTTHTHTKGENTLLAFYSDNGGVCLAHAPAKNKRAP
jgi:arylsulfatase A-like enzyme